MTARCVFCAAPLALVLSITTPISVIGGEVGETDSPDSAFPLLGRHGITLHAGLLSRSSVESRVSVGSTTVETSTSGFLGSLAYDYWIRPDWSVGLSAGAVDVGTNVTSGILEVDTGTATMVSLLFGATYQPEELALTPTMRPFVSLAVGPYIRSATETRVGRSVISEYATEAVFGARIRGGVNVFFSKRFKTEIVAGYHAVSDFDGDVGGDSNTSGFEFSAGLGILLGRGR